MFCLLSLIELTDVLSVAFHHWIWIYAMCYMQTEKMKIDKLYCKNLGLYFTVGLGSDGSVVQGVKGYSCVSAVFFSIKSTRTTAG